MESTNDKYNIDFLPDDFNQYDLSFKIIAIGDSGVGKSCLISQAARNHFDEFYQATIGFEFVTFNLKINNCIIKLQIWDTCGQEIYRSLISNFYRNSSLAILIYAVDNQDSFKHIDSWLNDLKVQSNADVKIFMVGNKCDLTDTRVIDKTTGEEYAKTNNLDGFLETSAKNGYNTKNILVEAGKSLYREYMQKKEQVSKSITSTISLTNQNAVKINQEKNNDDIHTGMKCC